MVEKKLDHFGMQSPRQGNKDDLIMKIVEN